MSMYDEVEDSVEAATGQQLVCRHPRHRIQGLLQANGAPAMITVAASVSWADLLLLAHHQGWQSNGEYGWLCPECAASEGLKE